MDGWCWMDTDESVHYGWILDLDSHVWKWKKCITVDGMDEDQIFNANIKPTSEEAPTFLIFWFFQFCCWHSPSSSYYSDDQTCFASLLVVWQHRASIEEAFSPFSLQLASRDLFPLLWFYPQRKTGMETDGWPRPVNWETAKDGEGRRSGRGSSSHSHISKK